MRNISVPIACLLLTMSFAPATRADENSYRAAVQEYFTIAQMDTVIQRSMNLALAAQTRANPQLKQIEPTLRQFFVKYMSWKALQEDFTAIYMKAFTENEFKQLLAFYKTPVGRKALQQMPALMEQGAALGLKRVQDHMTELQKMIEDSLPKGDQSH
ncbi:MAG TPA: DUF2059 domain-containing protein [Polyangiaceae bacterium]|nr:DUF2059 domain-containing protein [Polyangiaceae bacterium]